ncbi:stomatin-4-like [Leguminivora glycinivorella]|uniref:stomatin-4-like n=1 Tax=Leguminivora glycinivorella TaxID=1035111 RepID=UPI00200C99DA|nr:stomatin-4-like [Leguminivora glycinivorella]
MADVVKEYRRAVILRFGRVRKDSPAGPGIIWVIPCTDSVIQIDLRTQSINLPPQLILTKDYVTANVGAVVNYRVYNPLHCLLNIRSHMDATEMLTISVLRNIISKHSLTDVLALRESISLQVKTEVAKSAADWGVKIEQVEIKDIGLPVELQKAMAAEAEGRRTAKANIIASEGEVKTAEYLTEASKMMEQNPQIMLCLTKDSLTLTVQAVVYFRVIEPLWSIVNVADFNMSTKYLAATALRNTIGRHRLSELLYNRSEISIEVLEAMENLTTKWGVYVIRIEMNNISIPLQLKQAMATEAVSLRLSNAKIMVAQAEIESVKSLEKATSMLMGNPIGMQLRYLQSLQSIAGEKTHTIVFPYSKDMLRSMFAK